MFGSYLWFCRVHSSHANRGCDQHPAFPAPSVCRGWFYRIARTRNAPRERGCLSSSLRVSSLRAQRRRGDGAAMTPKLIRDAAKAGIQSAVASRPITAAAEYWIARLRGR
jgi:hypothetical protein